MVDITLGDGDLISRRASIIAADTVDQAILLDIDSGDFFQLNKSAARIWNLVEQPISFADLCASLEEKFEIGAADCRLDVAHFVGELCERRILIVHADG